MRVRIDAIASHTGMTGVFKLLSADVYEVVSAEKVEGFIDTTHAEGEAEPASAGPRGELKALQLVSQRACRAKHLDELLNAVLETLDEGLGFRHSSFFMLDESETKLFSVATRGYGVERVGAEVALGEGLIGTVAQERKLVRVSDVDEELRYGRAVRASAQRAGAGRALRPEIPLPGLPDAMSQMAIPLVVGQRLLGVLAVESPDRLSFDEWDEAFLEIVANQVAVTLDNLLHKAAEDEGSAQPTPSEPPAPPSPSTAKQPLHFRFYTNDDCVFLEGEYLIRNVPGRILWKVLRELSGTRRTEFANRELRLDPWIGLPAVRDNLESRLVLLRKRLEEKCPDLRIVRTTRGRFKIETDRPVLLEESDGS